MLKTCYLLYVVFFLLFFFSIEHVYPCDSSPCYNDGTCVEDPQNVSKYHCQCRPWLTGRHCEGGLQTFSMIDFRYANNSDFLISNKLHEQFHQKYLKLFIGTRRQNSYRYKLMVYIEVKPGLEYRSLFQLRLS